jgi:hypothetical protein
MSVKIIVVLFLLRSSSEKEESKHLNPANKASFDARAATLQSYYESNYSLADLYEAWAIWCFCRLCVGKVHNVSLEQRWDGAAKQLFVRICKFLSLEQRWDGAAKQLFVRICFY